MPTWYISIFSSTGPSFNLSSVSRIRIFGVNCCYNQPVICGLGLWVLVVILPSLQIVTCYNQQIHETEAPIELIFLVPQQIVTFFFLFFCFSRLITGGFISFKTLNPCYFALQLHCLLINCMLFHFVSLFNQMFIEIVLLVVQEILYLYLLFQFHFDKVAF